MKLSSNCCTSWLIGVVTVECPCGRIAEYMPGVLQRLHRVASDLLV
jgi:hypothetical protein